MTYKVGDTVFLSQGQPALVSGRDKLNGTTLIDRDIDEVRKQSRHGYLNGVAPERREELLSILDDVKAHEEPKQRVEELQKKIDELKADPNKNMQFVRYLEAEQGHIMNISGYRPRFFGTEEHKIR